MRYTDRPGSELLIEAKKLHKRGQFDASLELYSRVLTGDPTSLDAAVNCAAILVLSGPPSVARRALHAAEPLARSNARACRDLGFAWLALGETGFGEAAFARALQLDPSLVGARLALAGALLELDRQVPAVEQAREAVRRAPDEAASWAVLHHVLFEEDPGAARGALEQSITLDPSWVVPSFLLACDLATRGRLAEAEQLLCKSTVAEGLVRLVRHAATLPPGFVTFTSRAGLLRHALELAPRDGLVLEFGVHHGASARVLANHLEAERGDSTVRELFAFDSFRGLPEAWQGKPAGVFSTNGEPPPLPQSVEVCAGWFEETLPAFLSRHDGRVGFVHLDADLYSSTHAVLKHLEGRMFEGTVLVFDEYFGNASWEQDEFRAFREFIAHTGHHYEHLAVNWLTGQAAVRLSCRGGCLVPLR